MTKSMPCLRFAIGILSVVAASVLVHRAPAQESGADRDDVLAVVALPSYEHLLADVDLVGKLIQRPGLPAMVEGGLAFVTGGQGLAGLDKSKPSGVVLLVDGAKVQPLGMLPVHDLDMFLEALKPIAKGKFQPADDGTYELDAKGKTVYLKQHGKWTLIARQRAAFDRAPENPEPWLTQVAGKYDLAARLFVQNIPAERRQQAIDNLRQGLQTGLKRQDGESNAQFESRRRIAENSVRNLITAVEETEHVTLGWNLDESASTARLDLHVQVLPGSGMARQAARLAGTTSGHRGFLLPDAAMTFNLSFPAMDAAQVENGVAMVAALRAKAMQSIEQDDDLASDEAKALVGDIVSDLLGVLEQTAREGKLDGGAVVKLKPEAMTLAAGGRIADGAKLEDALRRLVELAARHEQDFPVVRWDVDRSGDVRLHALRAPVKNDKDAARLLGDPVSVVIGIGGDSLYVAVGREAMPTMKSVIEHSGEAAGDEAPPMQLVFSLGQILAFVAAQEEEVDPGAEALVKALADAAGRDKVHLTLTGHPRGFLYRMEAESGVLEAVGKAIAENADLKGF